MVRQTDPSPAGDVEMLMDLRAGCATHRVQGWFTAFHRARADLKAKLTDMARHSSMA
jgi:hypothetical protein